MTDRQHDFLMKQQVLKLQLAQLTKAGASEVRSKEVPPVSKSNGTHYTTKQRTAAYIKCLWEQACRKDTPLHMLEKVIRHMHGKGVAREDRRASMDMLLCVQACV